MVFAFCPPACVAINLSCCAFSEAAGNSERFKINRAVHLWNMDLESKLAVFGKFVKGELKILLGL